LTKIGTSPQVNGPDSADSEITLPSGQQSTTKTDEPAKFLQGSLMRHVIVMSLSASIGLISIFVVDFVDLYFISLLGNAALTAAVGFAGTLLYFNMSVTVGLMIAVSALCSRRIGRGDHEAARQIATSIAVLGVTGAIIFAILFWVFTPQLLQLLGARGDAAIHGTRYLRIIVPSMPVMMLAMVCSGLLRAHGDARRAMNVTLAAGLVNAVLDPILIFGFSMGLEGAAWASVMARIAMTITALWPIVKRYGGFAIEGFTLERFVGHLPIIAAIAAPAILTNLATPTGNLLVMQAIAPYGDDVVAAVAIIGRMMPLAFCVIFALSGAVGPIMGQNFGAEQYGRVRETLRKAVVFTALYTLVMWGILFLSNGFIADQFQLAKEGRAVVFWFCALASPLLFFNGILFVANAAFNNLDRPLWSTQLNWARNTIGIVPFIWLGGAMAGAPGIIIGQGIGGIAFAALGFWFFQRLITGYESGQIVPADRKLQHPPPNKMTKSLTEKAR